MTWVQQYPNSFNSTQQTHEVLKNHDSELKRLYSLINQLFSGTGHAHTVNGNDGAGINSANIINTPTGNIVATNMQAAINELDVKKLSINSLPINITNGFTPIGGIIMWSGSIASIPINWHLCDGTSGTIDLRDKFILGAGSTYVVGATGGEVSHKLTVAEMPAHTHALGPNGGITGAGWGSQSPAWGSVLGATPITATASTGGDGLHNNMPPYFALAYIQRIT